MPTIIETPMFVAEAARILSEDERLGLSAVLAGSPQSGEVIPGSGGRRKVRWSRPGTGKRGGVRVIYLTRLHEGGLWMLMVYPKSAKDDIPGHILRQIRRELEDVNC